MVPPHEDTLLPESVAEIIALDLKLVEVVFDRGFTTRATLATTAGLGARIFIAGSPQNNGSRRTRRRLASHGVGYEGRIAHLKREYGAGRSRLKGATGARIWAGWAALAYNLDTVARLPVKTSWTGCRGPWRLCTCRAADGHREPASASCHSRIDVLDLGLNPAGRRTRARSRSPRF